MRTRSTTARSTTPAVGRDAGDRRGVCQGRRRRSRSVMFAFVTLEEQGLLGFGVSGEASAGAAQQDRRRLEFRRCRPVRSVARHDGRRLRRVAARRHAGGGAEEAATASPAPDPEPEKGSFYRSDHISLAKVGVPMLYAGRRRRHASKAARRRAWRCATTIARTAITSRRTNSSDGWDLRGPVETMDVAVRSRRARSPIQAPGRPGTRATSSAPSA